MTGWLVLAIVALVFWGITGITQKLSTRYTSAGRSLVWFALAFPPLTLCVLPFVTSDWPRAPGTIALIVLGGFLNGLGVWTSFAALESGGRASVCIPLIYVYPLVTVAGAWLLLGERIGPRQAAGILLAVVAVGLLSREPPET